MSNGICPACDCEKCLKQGCVIIMHDYTFSFLSMIVMYMVAKAQNFKECKIHCYGILDSISHILDTENVPVTQIISTMLGNSIEKKWK